jgi:hypothetical protein
MPETYYLVTMRYNYSFQVWPDESKMSRFPPNSALFELFSLMSTRLEITKTEPQFDAFRAELAAAGITLREIERVQYYDPETVL